MKAKEGRSKILEYIQSIKAAHLFNDKLGCISIRVDEDNILISPPITDKYFSLDDIELISSSNVSKNINTSELEMHREIYKNRKDINAIIHLYSYGVNKVCSNNKPLPAVLDDMAQIIGPSINVTGSDNSFEVKKLKGRYGVLLKNNGGLCGGRSLQEAFVACQVFEKSCRVYYEAEKIGGVKPLSPAIAYAMHQVYLRVYSKRRL